ncbi:phosphopantothenoylcysteine decarboxylase / phosphopantothenate--cysteine ligase [Rubrobacter radiotolerans]|uniref:Coenzyme A biosynthesis bifunctional protein CoaBC n=1 Tax=Rubrobacter radiotolerans TaxID=42256 RepID=A0A023X3I9_RUBRA|nr:bifunctional phosphopantothenoylcysteine decarboxylase/phosphopantothenate--cysteine ligase CoaBC [Rubrobacter radiotolerans]AHY46761.1 phosphopantothenoylcysteine decarboxylase / phosphopantothenate--cysteine ligase [Rubrobacter radiotolerans]MDX5894168.1 bifunctional phosphopantothenoylcysteine decarboxylase/phosphopantothenate--cysteine ligase CoaBC [Rubrobacter radiotolerans]SMC05370.1 phosphopantothenoylcysteine decarboxylase / phosphopantothenate--cysteine ligase [Rubrobacter radiotoler
MILCVVGASSGALEAPGLVRELVSAGESVAVRLDEKARLFVGPSAFLALGAEVVSGDGVPEAEAVVYLPATTETVARLARGLAGDPGLPEPARLFVVPEIDPGSAENPAVRENLKTLRRDGCAVLGTAGESVTPARAVAAAVLGGLGRLRGGPLAGRRVLVTAGGTHEPIDSVRFIGNRSSGRMGLAVAREASRMGAEVEVIAANVAESLVEPGVAWTPVETVKELSRAVRERAGEADVLVMAAAVSDFTPASPVREKIRRGQNETMSLDLRATEDVLAGVREVSERVFLVGFAATHGDPAPDAREKLARKGADLIVGNDISREDIGFSVEENEVIVVGPDTERLVKRAAKIDVARAILDEVIRRLDR